MSKWAIALVPALIFAIWACGSSGGNKGFQSSGPSSSSGGGSGGGSGGSGSGAGGGDGGSLVGDGSTGSSSGGTVPCGGSSSGSMTNTGCEYYLVDPDVDLGGNGGCFTAYVANVGSSSVQLSVDFDGTTYDPSKFAYIATGSGANIQYAPIANGTLPAGEVALLFLNDVPGANDGVGSLACPKGVTPAFEGKGASLQGTGIGKSFHIVSTGPIAAYDIYPYGGGQTALTSATLLLPTTSWGTNYVAVDAYGAGGVLADLPFVAIVAGQDGTQVTINPTSKIVGGNGVAAGPQGQATTYSLSRGQVLQLVQNDPLDGSIIQSNNPVGVWGGKTSVSIDACCDDSAHQQIPPVRALGSEYVGVRYRNRYDGIEESPPWRIIGGANGTVLTWDPAPPSGAPTSLALGQVAEFESNGPWVVSSQDDMHPFYMSAHMTGGALYDPSQQDGGSNATPDGRGDAEFVNVVPPGEFMKSYVFFTDPTYPETDLVIVRAQGSSGFADVTLDCAGTLSAWQPVGNGGKYQYTRFDLVTGNFQGTGNCNNGRHEIKSDAPFGVTVWGWGSAATGQVGMGFYTQYVSYAYPAGAAVAPINPVVIPPVNQ